MIEDIFLEFRSPDEYPDAVCVVKMKDGKELRMEIEFEWFSSNFKKHGHDPRKCNLIVCALHNWEEAPIPVLEVFPNGTFFHGKGIKVVPTKH